MRTMSVKHCLDCKRPTSFGSRCPACQKARDAIRDARRGTRKERGYDAEWYRIQHLAIAAHPYCSVPGCTARDLTGDHIIPHSKGGTNTIDNVRVLCRR